MSGIDAIVQDVVTLARPALFNLYFALASIPFGFPFAVLLALGKASENRWVSALSRGYLYAFRGSPLFIQFFMVYSVMLAFNLEYWKPMGIDHIVLHPLFLGPLILVLNTSAYAGEIFHGALKSIPSGQLEAARAIGIEWCINQSRELMAHGVPCLHYYSMGKSESIRKVACELF